MLYNELCAALCALCVCVAHYILVLKVLLTVKMLECFIFNVKVN